MLYFVNQFKTRFNEHFLPLSATYLVSYPFMFNFVVDYLMFQGGRNVNVTFLMLYTTTLLGMSSNSVDTV